MCLWAKISRDKENTNLYKKEYGHVTHRLEQGFSIYKMFLKDPYPQTNKFYISHLSFKNGIRPEVFLLWVDVFEGLVGYFHGAFLKNAMSPFNQKEE